MTAPKRCPGNGATAGTDCCPWLQKQSSGHPAKIANETGSVVAGVVISTRISRAAGAGRNAMTLAPTAITVTNANADTHASRSRPGLDLARHHDLHRALFGYRLSRSARRRWRVFAGSGPSAGSAARDADRVPELRKPAVASPAPLSARTPRAHTRSHHRTAHVP